MLPRFLLADNSQELPETIFVVHTEFPKFIVESDIDDFYSNQVVHWIDDEPNSEDAITTLLEEAEDFLIDELDMNDELYEDE